MTQAYNCDCLEYMKTVPDKFFDLAIVDPPYGDGQGGGVSPIRTEVSKICKTSIRTPTGRFARYIIPTTTSGFLDAPSCNREGVERTGGTWASKYGKSICDWDVAPSDEYFKELFRVSKNQIIWGGNYFNLPPTRCFVVWRKLTISDSFSMAMAEYAWTSFNANAKVFEFAPQGKPGDVRFHPTQKPVELYKWLLSHYAKQGDKILDTHLGSGSSRIAADDLGFDFVGCEIDKYYFEKQEERFKAYSQQLRLF